MNLSKQEIAEYAYDVNYKRLKLGGGKQDEYAVAFGGLNFTSFNKNICSVSPIKVRKEVLEELQKNLVLFYTGKTRTSSSILYEMAERINNNDPIILDALDNSKKLTFKFKDLLERGDLEQFGELLNENWKYKKNYAMNITTKLIDKACKLGLKSGAKGALLIGAGNGGFLMFFIKPEFQINLEKVMNSLDLRRYDFSFESEGVKVVYP